MQEFRDGRLLLIKVGPLGPFANNAYVVADSDTREAWVIDAPQDSEKVLPAVASLNVQGIAITHRHGDHWGGLDALVEATKAPVYCHSDDVTNREVAGMLADGQEIAAGSVRLRVLHTPGHTPGSICFVVGGHLLSGDTLFPGGPGRTMRPEDLKQEIESITARLFVLPEATQVHPGHGDDTTIAAAKREHAVFASKPHPAELAGDVTWLNS